MIIELAPSNKVGLRLATPLIAGSGAAGLGDSWPPGVSPSMFGALVTAPFSLRPQRGQAAPRLAEVPGGYLLATADHNPGYSRVVRDYVAAWARMGIPVVAALAGSTPGDWARLAGHLEEVTAIAGLELALPGDIGLSDASAWIGAVRRASTLPLLAKLPATLTVELAGACAESGADALVVATAPLAAYATGDSSFLEAPVGGPAAFPFTLRALRAVVRLGIGLPVVASGGIYRIEDARLCLEMGAIAVKVRGLLWSDPAAAARLAAELRPQAGAVFYSSRPVAKATE